MMLMLVMCFQLIPPKRAKALTSGPVQPEAQSFEPVGTTDMVDPFTGDFNYNIPLLDVEGYPINIAYHGGVGMEQEASWVGLGWNINPGAVNRQMRGLPDDFAGDTVEKELYIRPDTTIRIGLGTGVELAGAGDPYMTVGLDLGGYLTINNYRGVSVDFTSSGGINLHAGPISAGINLGTSIGSQTGAAIDYGASVGVGSPRNFNSDITGSINASIGGNYNPRNGMRNAWNFSKSNSFGKDRSRTAASSTSVSVQIGGFNQYSPVVTNRSYMNSYSGQLKFGGSVYSVFMNGKANASFMKTEFDSVGHRKGYGYLHLHDADSASLLDFQREKDGNWNPTMQLLPQTHLAYDVYDVSGQGTGGSFRPFRNDIGSVYDPVTGQSGEKDDYAVEAGIPWLFSLGAEFQHTTSTSESGPWTQYVRKHIGPQGGYYEDVYFKEAGEITQNNDAYLGGPGSSSVVIPEDMIDIGVPKTGSDKRVVRGNYIYPISGTGRDAERLLDDKQLQSYDDTNGFAGYPAVHKTVIPRTNGTTGLSRRPSQTTEIVQIQKDGRRYVYGLPVLNNVQREVTFAARRSLINNSTRSSYLVDYVAGEDDAPHNGNGVDEFYSSMVTPTYVATHLLTAVLSNDYSDVTGNGISDDDLGTYTKFNYSRKSKDYRWRSPARSGKAQYNPGYYTDTRDDRGSYMTGSREQWMLHSIETKNYVAEFYVSERKDARGVLDAILGSSGSAYYKGTRYNQSTNDSFNRSYKLDSIVLYNKHDRFQHGAGAHAIKSVHFSYDYFLCKNTPNSVADSGGKLTLRKIQIRYGTSSINMSAAYVFNYDGAYNYDYNEAYKDRWGNYMKPAGSMNNFEFPFTRQDSLSDAFAKAWSLSSIGLPSGGVIKVDYEADDYGYVQDKPANQMFLVAGVGSSPQFSEGNQLYLSERQPFLYYYFKRQKPSENPQLSLHENYLAGTTTMYYNVAVALADGRYEPVKGYATVREVGRCTGDTNYCYVRMEARDLEGMNGLASPVVYTALNLGRYSLPHIMFPGANPDASDMDNMVAGLRGAVGEMFNVRKNPLKYYMQQGKAKRADLSRSFIRLTAPGLKKKGGGQRVKAIKFYDNWSAMAGGSEAVYGREYFYTADAEGKKGTISSGVASWEPMTGGDENPHRLPADYQAQETLAFPPNDPVELYQETPLGESFFPGGVVGYSKVTSRSINQDKGRSSQSEDISTFYTARDYPTITQHSAINNPLSRELNLTDITYTRRATQGFVIKLNDMHGKPWGTEHWILKPGSGTGAREAVSSQENIYFEDAAGRLSSLVPAFAYSPGAGQLSVQNMNMGTESDITVDSRIRNDETKTFNLSANLNGFPVFAVPVAIPLGYGFPFTTISNFKMATVTKVIQQYGILQKVITKNQDANTELHNEVFDPLTGNVLVTSINNEFGDRQYTVSFPAHWAYKEMGPAYENMNRQDVFAGPIIIDTFGVYAARFVNYNGAYSYSYRLPSNMPVGLTAVDEQMPKFKLGDELLVYLNGNAAAPIRLWVMGYTSDVSHCYAVLASREPYKASGDWSAGHTIAPSILNDFLTYQVVRSGNRNRLGETIQSFTTTDSTNIFPYLKNNLTGLINLTAQRYNHNLNQVFAANVISDSLNPFVTGKVGIYRPQTEILNIRRRDYFMNTSRDKGTFSSASYWKTERDNFPGYCSDSLIAKGLYCQGLIDSIRFTFIDSSHTAVDFYPSPNNSHTPCRDSAIYITMPCQNCGYPYPAPNGESILYNGVPSTSGEHIIVDWTNTGNPSLDTGGAYFNFLEYCGCPTRINIRWTGAQYSVHAYGPATYQFNQYSANVYVPASIGSTSTTPYRVQQKILLGKVGHYDGADNENWVRASQVTKYNWFGAEIENREEGLGYNSAVYGYGQQLPVCVARNARHGEVLFEGFEDYNLLRPVPGAWQQYMRLIYSPFEPFINVMSSVGSFYQKFNLAAGSSGGFTVSGSAAHTGNYSIVTTDSVTIPLDGTAAGMSTGYSFGMHEKQKYVASVWVKSASGALPAPGQNYGALVRMMSDTGLSASSQLHVDTLRAKTGVIEGWQQFEVTFEAPAGYRHFALKLNSGYYFDDLRIYPFESNSKGFVYDPVTRKLTATLDENNFATFYEYDAEGNLVRTKKETDQGVLTITETRSTHRKMQ